MPPTNTLLIANPGTGKTTALAARVIELLKSGVKEEDILCITFTVKATGEMRSKIDAGIKAAKLDSKAYKINVHTFHSYALSYLQERGLARELMGTNILRYSIFRSFQENHALNYGTDYIISDIVPDTENAIRYLKSFGILPGAIDLKKASKHLEKIYAEEEITNISLEENKKFLEYFITAFKDYETAKTKDNSMDYNDMLLRFMDHYDPSKHKYPHVLVDELQDVNEIEAQIALKSAENIFLVGDRKQAIFGFQGGSIGNFRLFEGIKGMEKQTKGLNYRSLSGILEYAKGHFLANTQDTGYAAELSGFKANRKDGKAEVKLIVSPNIYVSGANALAAMLKRKECKNNTFAIITRTNGQLLKISAILDQMGIEYGSTGGASTSDSAKSEITAYLRGLFYDDDESIIAALFTPFSGLTLKESLKLSESKKAGTFNIDDARPKAKAFFDARGQLTKDSISTLFREVIMPVCVSIGRDYYLTATAMHTSLMQFFDSVPERTREALFNYLAITEEDYDAPNAPHQVMLTTVHKAKGLEFDNVIYLPTKARQKMSFTDAVTNSIILATKDIDVREELEEEGLRVDFVAFTRARDRLTIITEAKGEDRYYMPGLMEHEVEQVEDVSTPDTRKYDEAYAMFLNGRREESRKITSKKDEWLMELINSYFSSIEHLSFTNVESADEPYEFLKKYILRLPEPRGTGFAVGSRIHDIAEMRFKGTLDMKTVTKEEKPFYDNLVALDRAIVAKYKMKQVYAEHEVTVPLKDVLPSYNGALTFFAKIDAIYESDEGGKKYLILDYKTDKNTDYASAHRKQLTSYKRAFGAANHIKEEDIVVAIGFVGLRGKINTGVVGMELDDAVPRKTTLDSLNKDLQTFVDYINSPKKFADAVLEEKSEEILFTRVVKALVAK